MLIGINKMWIICLCITHCASVNTTWLNNLIDYARNDSKLYEVLLMTKQDDKNMNSKVEEIISKISRQIPTLKISFQEAIKKKNQYDSSSQFNKDLRRTSLIVVIYKIQKGDNLLILIDPIEYILKLCKASISPKFLIILVQEQKNYSYETLLRRMWSKKILDATVLEIKEKKLSQNRFTQRYQENITIHYFNPFKNTMIKEGYSSTTSWFPDKLRDIKKHPVTVGLYNLPSSTTVESNKNGVIVANGPDVELIRTISKKINFEVIWKDIEQNGNMMLNYGDKKEHWFKMLERGTLDMLVPQLGLYVTCQDDIECASGTRIVSLIVAVPVFREKSELSTEWNIFHAIVIFSFTIIIWFLSRQLHFERNNWNILQLIAIIFGLVASREPKKTVERIVFGSILLACLLYSSVIYTSITENASNTGSNKKFATLKDVLSSSLRPMIKQTVQIIFRKRTDGVRKKLLEKAIPYSLNSEAYCIDRLIKNKNIACIGRKDVIKFLIKNKRDDCYAPAVMIVEEPFTYTTISVLTMEYKSPFVKRIEGITAKIVESGINHKWTITDYDVLPRAKTASGSCSSSMPESTLLRKQIIYTLLFGYICSVVAFGGEILAYYIIRRKNRVSNHIVTS